MSNYFPMNWFHDISMCIDSRQSIQLCPYHTTLSGNILEENIHPTVNSEKVTRHVIRHSDKKPTSKVYEQSSQNCHLSKTERRAIRKRSKSQNKSRKGNADWQREVSDENCGYIHNLYDCLKTKIITGIGKQRHGDSSQLNSFQFNFTPVQLNRTMSNKSGSTCTVLLGYSSLAWVVKIANHTTTMQNKHCSTPIQ